MQGVYLILAHPKHAKIDCKTCQMWLHNKDFELSFRGGKPIRRYKGFPPPCMVLSASCPKGKPDGMSELTARNWRAYQHYLECKAVGSFPDDAIVRRNARYIRQAEDAAERKIREELAMLSRGSV